MVKDGKYINDEEYRKRLKKLDVFALRYLIKDAQEAQAANPDNPNNGYYADEVSYAAMELRRRGIP